MSQAPLIIIGSGLAGYMLAKEWRKLDAQTPLIIVTADDGGFYSKPLLSTALTQHKAPEQLLVSAAKAMAEELNARMITHTQVTAIDPVALTITLNGLESLKFAKLVLACGAAPVAPPLTGAAAQIFQTVNSLCDYRRFREWLGARKHIVILGAGLVGCEFANDLLNAGFAVTVIAPDRYPLEATLPAAVGNVLQKQLAAAGLAWRLGECAVNMEPHDGGVCITLSSGQEIFADGVLSAIGLRPRLELARNAGITVNRGIVVDRWHRTNFPEIFALGDCAEVDGLVQMYVAPLLQSARALAKILAGGHEPVHFPVMPVVLKTPALPLVFYSPPPQIAGEWRLEGEGAHLRALFHDESGQLRGFALAGDKIRDKMPLAKQLLLYSQSA
jgi:rubredoxin---NAD+ reductase